MTPFPKRITVTLEQSVEMGMRITAIYLFRKVPYTEEHEAHYIATRETESGWQVKKNRFKPRVKDTEILEHVESCIEKLFLSLPS